LLQQATPFSHPAPLEPRWMTRCDRFDVDCFYVSTVTDSPSKVLAIAAAPIWYDARLRSHSNGMTSAGLAGNVWGLLNSPHALAIRFHQYIFDSSFFSRMSPPRPSHQLFRRLSVVGKHQKPDKSKNRNLLVWYNPLGERE
jgi:hypothetical protein